MKIIDKINAKAAAGEKFFSFEYFPPKTEEGVRNLTERQRRMAALGPQFCDITWGAGGSTAELTLEIAARMQAEVGVETMMHLTCTNMPVAQIDAALDACRAAGITNVLALRGDPPHGQETFTQVEGGFACALDLVRHIRARDGDFFCVGVAGYPEAHPDAIVDDPAQMAANYAADVAYLRRKVEAGADFVVTQLFYDVSAYFKFVADCRAAGVTVPILPGVMPILSYAGFKRMTAFCKTRVPAHALAVLELIKDSDEAVKAYGVSLGAMMCERLLAEGAPGLHMYTLNLEKSAVGILRAVGLLPAAEAAANGGAAAEEEARPLAAVA